MQSKKILKTILIVLFFVAIVTAMGILLVNTMNYVEDSIFEEREVHLTAQAESVATILNNVMKQDFAYARICSTVVSNELDGGNIYDYMNSLCGKVHEEGLRVVLVDDHCTWYGEGHTTGRVTSVKSYTPDSDEELLYMTVGVDADVESMVFRIRLPQPLEVETVSGTTTTTTTAKIEYCAVISYMDDMSQYFTDAFPFRSNNFILDNNGLMLYKDLNVGYILEGTNVLQKYSRVEFIYGGSGDEQLQRLSNGETVVGEFAVDEERYFICTSPLAYNGWYISFVFPETELSSGMYIKTVTTYLMTISTIFSVLFIITLIVLMLIRENRIHLAAEKEQNAVLSTVSTAKSNFLSNMSHDIRTPINGILGMSAIALREQNPEKTDECLHKIQTSSNYLLSLVNDVLDMSSIESGKMTIKNQPMDLKAFVESCGAIAVSLIHNKSIDFLCDYSAITHPYVLGDEAHLRQILINILSNAVKFTPDGGFISLTAIEVDCDGDTVRVSFEVSDTGIGMEQEFLDKIWDRFSQGAMGSRAEFKGTGLGMAISRELTELMGGTITVESELGSGSTFKVEIPFSIDKEPAKQEVLTDFPVPDCSGIRILVAEDNMINMEITTDLLERTGATVLQASDGQEALEIFSSTAPGEIHLILMDIMMPRLNGNETARAIRALNREDALCVPIIAMTANTYKDDVESSMQSGMNDHLSKPVDERALYYTLSQFCKKED